MKRIRVWFLFLRNFRVIGHQRGIQGIPGKDVRTSAQNNGRRVDQVVQEAPQRRLHLLHGTVARPVLALAGEFEKVVPLVVVQTKHLRQSGQHRPRCLDAALFKACVVLGAEGGKLSDFLTAQSLDPSHAARLGQAHWAGAQFGPAGLEELAQLVEMRVASHTGQCDTEWTDIGG